MHLSEGTWLPSGLAGWAHVAGQAVPLALGLVIWERWFHVDLLSEAPTSTGRSLAVEFFVVLAMAIVAVVVGWRAVRQSATSSSPGVKVLRRGLVTAAVLGGLVALAIAADEMLFDQPGVTAAPGAGYLSGDSGLAAALSHGLRDGLVAQLVLLPLALCIAAVTRPEARGAGDASDVASNGAAPPSTRAMASAPATHTRREALQYGVAGTFITALGSGGLVAATAGTAHAAPSAPITPWLTTGISLFINEGTVRMIDGTPVYMWGWGFQSQGVDDREGLNTPGPVIWTYESETVELSVTNTLNEDHSFVIDGVVDSGVIAPGQTVVLTFDAPSAGSYLYQDGLNGPVNRVLGLHGALLVMPADRSLRSHPSLDAAYWTFDSQWVWMFNEIDPTFNAIAQADRPIDPSDFLERFTPRYFTINGRSGSLAAHVETAPDTVIEDAIGKPALIRMINAGVATHCPHMHGNHFYVLSDAAELTSPIMWKDSVMMKPESRKDCFLPFHIPPNAVYWPPHPDGAAFLRELHGVDMEGKFPMHCHMEMSQTANGGLYPQGLLTDWKIT